eukprot:66330_1
MTSLIAQWIEGDVKPRFREKEISNAYCRGYLLVVGYLRTHHIIFDHLAPITRQLLVYYSIPLSIKDMDQSAFYRWVCECTPNGVVSKDMDEFIKYLHTTQIGGVQIIEKCRTNKIGSFLSLLYDQFPLLQSFFPFLCGQIMHDWLHESIAFDHFTPTQFGAYVRAQSASFVANAFKKHGYDGKKYEKDRDIMLDLLTKQCGFDMNKEVANAFLDAIDGYPQRSTVTVSTHVTIYVDNIGAVSPLQNDKEACKVDSR